MNDNTHYHEQNLLMRRVAQKHVNENPYHHCIIYGNFVECDECHYHAHLAGHDYMIHHNSDYKINEKVS